MYTRKMTQHTSAAWMQTFLGVAGHMAANFPKPHREQLFEDGKSIPVNDHIHIWLPVPQYKITLNFVFMMCIYDLCTI